MEKAWLVGVAVLVGVFVVTAYPEGQVVQMSQSLRWRGEAEEEEVGGVTAMRVKDIDLDECDKCVPFARCVDGKCHCMWNLEGDPKMSCYRPEATIICSLFYEPEQIIRTFSGESAAFHLLGSSRFAELEVSRRGPGQGTCHFHVDGWTERDAMGMCLKGVQFQLRQVMKNGHESVLDVRIMGMVDEDDNYAWMVERKVDYEWKTLHNITSDGLMDSKFLLVSGCAINFRRTKGPFAQVSIVCCRISFAFRPNNMGSPNRIPGFWIEAKRSRNPTFSGLLPVQQPLCLTSQQIPSLGDIVNQTGLPNSRWAISYLAMTNDDLVDYPGAPTSLGELQNMARRCPNLNQLYGKAGFMLRNPRFQTCVSTNPGEQDIADLFLATAKWFCDKDHASCVSVKSKINKLCSRTIRAIPPVKNLLAMSCPRKL